MNQDKLNRMIISAMTFDAGHHGGQSESEEMFEALKQFEKSIAEDKELNDLVLDAIGIAIAHGPKDAICDLEKLHDRVSGKASAKWGLMDRFMANDEYYTIVSTDRGFGAIRESNGYLIEDVTKTYDNIDHFMNTHWTPYAKKVEKD